MRKRLTLQQKCHGIMAILCKEPAPLTPYTLSRALGMTTSKSMYPALSWLIEAGYVKHYEAPVLGKPARYFWASDEGKAKYCEAVTSSPTVSA